MKPFKLILPLLLLLAASCSVDEECRQTESVRCVFTFECSTLVVEEDTSYISTFTTIDSITVKGEGIDSVLYDNQKMLSKISLPLRSDTTETRYQLTINSYPETLVIRHRNNDYFVSLACGCFVFHEVDTAFGTNGIIYDSEVLNTAVQNSEQDNVKLYITY